MFKLVQNELMKMFKRPGTYVMIGLLLLIVGLQEECLNIRKITGSR